MLAVNYGFIPAVVQIETGGTVVWQNMTTSIHNVNGDVDSQTGLPFGNPEAFMLMSSAGDEQGTCLGSVQFNTPGVYTYDCSIGSHTALGMVGTIQVGLGGATPLPTTTCPSLNTTMAAAFCGCTDETACNCDAAATVDDSSCVLPAAV